MGRRTNSPLDDNLWIDFPEMEDPRGVLTVIGQQGRFDWPMQRLFIIRGVPSDSTRGRHAHRSLQQIILAAAGRFTLKLFDGKDWRSFAMTSPSRGIRIPQMIWVELADFSEGAAALVIADRPYDEEDYIRDLETYIGLVG